MTIRTRVEVEWAQDALRVVIYDNSPRMVRLIEARTEFDRQALRWINYEVDDTTRQPPEPAGVLIPEDAARALLEALLDHFRGGHDVRQLRADYDAERARVDRLIGALLEPT